MFKKFFCTALIFILLASPIYASAPPSVLSTTHRIQQSTFLEHDTCSGTSIGPHALLTATHCELGSDVAIVDGKERNIKARIRDGKDHTIYIVDGDKFEAIAVLSKSQPKPGDDIWIRGNPAGIPMLVRRGIYAGNVPQLSAVGPFMIAVGVINYYDFNGFFGDSGAAVFDADGQIIDVLSVLDTRNAQDNAKNPDKVSEYTPSLKLMGGFGLAFSADQLKQAAQ